MSQQGCACAQGQAWPRRLGTLDRGSGAAPTRAEDLLGSIHRELPSAPTRITCFPATGCSSSSHRVLGDAPVDVLGVQASEAGPRAAASREHNVPVGAQRSAASNAKRLFRWRWVRGPISGGPISGYPSCPSLFPLTCLVCPSELPAAPDAHSETTLCPFPRNLFSPPLLLPPQAPSFPKLA